MTESISAGPSMQPRARGSDFNHQCLRTAPPTRWKQFAPYSFIEAPPFIAFIPGSVLMRQGLNVTTPLCLFLMGGLTDSDDAELRYQDGPLTQPWDDSHPKGSQPSSWLFGQLEGSERMSCFRFPLWCLFPDLNCEV
jgi:hypothetical protein